MSSMSMRKPSYFRSIRVWFTIGVAVLIVLKAKPTDAMGMLILWCIPAFFLLVTAGISYKHKKDNVSTFDNFNEGNDGSWSHEFNDSKLLLNEKQQTITLKNGKNEKTYPFSSVIGWRYNLESGGYDGGFGTGAIRQQNLNNSGLFIEVKDVMFPEWQIKFYPQKGKFHQDTGYKDMEMQIKRWLRVLSQVINKE
ncbi:DUF4755 domain-containing protein [Pantoea sp. CCBC3-3-1]|uniref:DUF4755 domain-containing protein n=1 Tax=Pantoea sp. CCBC3-3-1 TaxID=2490851 RepID=UPI0011BE0432|nr:DUF4755 domain-containing protein [Pantoea sp. CCBC3-3-1]